MTLTPIQVLELDAETWSTPALAPNRIVAADRSGRIRAWDASGVVAWEHDTGAEITASPTLATVDGTPTILIGDHAGSFLAIDLASGVILWRCAFGAMIRATAAVAEVGGETAILLPVYGPRLVRLDARGQTVYDRMLPKNEVYQRGKDAGAVSSPLVADVDGDGRLEAVFGVRAQRVYCCDVATGEIRWFRPLAYDPDSSPTLCLDPASGAAQILVGGGEHTAGAGDNGLIALAPSDGRVLWRAPAGGGVDGAATVADLGAGERAVFCSLGSASAIATDLSGREVWRMPLGPTDRCVHDPICREPNKPYFTGRARCRSYTTPLVADLDGDGAPEVVVGSNNGALLVLDGASGAEKARGGFHGIVRGSAVLADVDGDGWCEMVVPSGESILVYETKAPPEAAWPQTKGEPTHLGWHDPQPIPRASGPAPRRVPSRLAWHSTGRDALRFAAFQVERRLLNPLGIRLAKYYY